jgi:hypothetical protein
MALLRGLLLLVEYATYRGVELICMMDLDNDPTSDDPLASA